MQQNLVISPKRWLQYKTVKAWVDGSESAKANGLGIFSRYMEWRAAKGLAGDPDALVDGALDGTNRTLVEHAQAIASFMDSDPGMLGVVDDSRTFYHNLLRGFYRANFLTLPKARIRRVGSGNQVMLEVTATRYLEMLRTVVRSDISPRNRSILVTKAQTGMDNSTLAKVFNYVAWAQLVDHFGTEDWSRWDERKVPVKVDLVRPKTGGYPHFTGLHRDAIACLKAWLSVRYSAYGPVRTRQADNPRMLPTSDPIYVVEGWAPHGGQRRPAPLRAHYVSELWKRLGMASGVNVKPQGRVDPHQGARRRYPFHAHEVRDTLITIGRRAGVDREVVDFFCGHKFDADRYDKDPWDAPEWFMQQYDRLGVFVNVVSGTEERIKKEAEMTYEQRLQAKDSRVREVEDRAAALERRAKSSEAVMRAMAEKLGLKVDDTDYRLDEG